MSRWSLPRSRWTFESAALVAALLAALLATTAQVAAAEHRWRVADDVQAIDCDELTAEFSLTMFPGGTPVPPAQGSIEVVRDTVHEGRGAVAFSYRGRNRQTPLLVCPVVLTGMRSFTAWMRADDDALLLFATTDRDGAEFSLRIPLAGGVWTEIYIEPADLERSASSPMAREDVKPDRLGFGFALVDAYVVVGSVESNRIVIDDVRIDRGTILKSEGAWVIDGTHEVIESSCVHDGPLEIRDGGSLRVESPRFTLRGALTVVDGTIEVADALLEIPQRHRSQFPWTLRGQSRAMLVEVTILDPHATDLLLRDESHAVLEGVHNVRAGFHAEVAPDAALTLKRVVSGGEFVIGPASSLDVRDSDGVLVWLSFPPGHRAELSLPRDEHIDAYSLTLAREPCLTVANSDRVWFGLIVTPNCDLRFTDSALRAIGLFYLEGETTITGLVDDSEYDSFEPDLGNRRITLTDCTVASWNFYSAGEATVRIRDCVFGEALAFGNSTIEIESSTCDGTGGFIGAQDDATLEVTGGSVDCDVTTFDRARLTLRQTTVTGTVSATGQSRIMLGRGTRVIGEKLTFDSARIVEDAD